MHAMRAGVCRVGRLGTVVCFQWHSVTAVTLFTTSVTRTNDCHEADHQIAASHLRICELVAPRN
jgi:hypothetical protein